MKPRLRPFSAGYWLCMGGPIICAGKSAHQAFARWAAMVRMLE